MGAPKGDGAAGAPNGDAAAAPKGVAAPPRPGVGAWLQQAQQTHDLTIVWAEAVCGEQVHPGRLHRALLELRDRAPKERLGACQRIVLL